MKVVTFTLLLFGLLASAGFAQRFAPAATTSPTAAEFVPMDTVHSMLQKFVLELQGKEFGSIDQCCQAVSLHKKLSGGAPGEFLGLIWSVKEGSRVTLWVQSKPLSSVVPPPQLASEQTVDVIRSFLHGLPTTPGIVLRFARAQSLGPASMRVLLKDGTLQYFSPVISPVPRQQ